MDNIKARIAVAFDQYARHMRAWSFAGMVPVERRVEALRELACNYWLRRIDVLTQAALRMLDESSGVLPPDDLCARNPRCPYYGDASTVPPCPHPPMPSTRMRRVAVISGSPKRSLIVLDRERWFASPPNTDLYMEEKL